MFTAKIGEDYPPYSPTDFTPLNDDCDFSPFNEQLDNESSQPVDMEISNSQESATDEEVELRSILIESLSKRSDELRLPSPTPNFSKQAVLKQAVLRLQHKTSKDIMISEKNESLAIEDENQTPDHSSRLITSLESVTKPVERMVINISPSDSDENAVIEKPDSFEKNLDSFLKTIRFRHETSGKKDETPTFSITQAKTVVSGLSKASQIEYQDLIQKIRILEAKRSRLKTKEVKRTIEKSGITSTAESSQIGEAPEKFQDPKTNAIKESLNKISSLDRESQLRILAKAENLYGQRRRVFFL